MEKYISSFDSRRVKKMESIIKQSIDCNMYRSNFCKIIFPVNE